MKEADEFFNRFQDALISNLFTCSIGRIEAYSAEKLTADITLLPTKDLIMSVPCGDIQTGQFIIRTPYKKGDLVVVVFAMRDIDAIMHDDGTEPTARKMSADDAIVVGGLNLFNKPFPAEVQDVNDGKTTALNPGDLIIARKDFLDRVILKESGGIAFYSDNQAGIEITAPMGVTIRADNPAGSGVRITGKTGGVSY